MVLCKCSLGYVDFSFDSTAKNFPIKSKFFPSKTKVDQKVFFSIVFFLKFFHPDTYTTNPKIVSLFFYYKSKFVCL